MKPECRQRVNLAAGRELTESEIAKIDDRMSATMKRLARQDVERWRGLSADQRVTEAAAQAVKDLQAEAALKKVRQTLQVLKTAQTETRLAQVKRVFGGGRNQSLVRDMEQTAQYIAGIKDESASHLLSLIDGANSGQGMGVGRNLLRWALDAENPGMTRDIALEIFSKTSGVTKNDVAKQAAKAWLDTIEGLRTRFNAAGGDVGALDYGYLPQAHDANKVLAKGQDAWAAQTMPLLDRSRYLNEDGSRMADDQVMAMLKASWETISSEGMNKQEPGAFKGTGMRANAGSKTRVIHYKDGESYLAYQAQFGQGSMYDAMIGHVGKLSRDIGLVERYGPNPAQQMRLQMDIAVKADNGSKRVFGNPPEAYWNVISGAAGVPENPSLARIGQDLRNIQTMGKLAGAVLSSITDMGTYFVTTGFNKLSYWDALTNIGRAATGDTKDFLSMHGVIAESMISNLNRWSTDNLRHGLTGRLANSTMKLSLMNAWTDTMRNGFGMTMMAGLGKLSKTEWGKLSDWDRTHLERKGLTEDDWAVISQAQLTPHRGQQFLTPEGIYGVGHERGQEIVSKVLGLIKDESEYAVMNPDLATKAIQTWGGTQAGTVKGELARSVMQFKSFPIAMISRHWRRMMDAPQGLDGAPALANKAGYGMALMLSTTALGAIAFQAKQITAGKDPAEMDNPRFWLRAMAQGGGWGIAGDLFLIDPTDNFGDASANAVKNIAGPTIGSAAELVTKIGIENAWQAAHGKETHLPAEGIRFARSHLPYVNLWYAKSAIDHMGMHALQENLSPGYLARMRARAQKDWGQSFWWAPTETLPSRAPDFANALGR
jgi:hypothetical protein